MRLKMAVLLAGITCGASATQYPLDSSDALMFGDIETITTFAEDTLPDLARRYSLGYEEIQRAMDGGPTDQEMERGVAQAEAQFVYQLQTVGGFGGKSDQLNAYNMFLGEPGYFAADLARYLDATPDTVKAAAARLRLDQRVILSVVPQGRLDLALPDSLPVSVS